MSFNKKQNLIDMRYLRMSRDLRQGTLDWQTAADQLNVSVEQAKEIISDIRKRHNLSQ